MKACKYSEMHACDETCEVGVCLVMKAIEPNLVKADALLEVLSELTWCDVKMETPLETFSEGRLPLSQLLFDLAERFGRRWDGRGADDADEWLAGQLLVWLNSLPLLR